MQIHSKTLVDALIADIREQTGTACERTDFKLEMLQPHLFMNFKVLDEHGRQIGMGRNLAELRAEFGAQAQETFRNVAQAFGFGGPDGQHHQLDVWGTAGTHGNSPPGAHADRASSLGGQGRFVCSGRV